jgi:hypothetical protein
MASPFTFVHDIDVDVVCVGAGLGGLAAAIRAHDLGLSVLLLESSSYVGGGAAYSGGLYWLPGLGEGDTLEAANEYLGYVEGERAVGGGNNRARLLSFMSEAARYYMSVGVNLDVVPGNPDVFYPDAPGSTASGRMFESAIAGPMLGEWRSKLMPSPHYRIGLRHRELYDDTLSKDEKQKMFALREDQDFLTMGLGLAGAFAHAALVQRRILCWTGHRAVRLLSSEGRVVGVEATAPEGGRVRVRARRGVLLATGGYGWSPDAADMEGLPDFEEAGPPSIAGDHLSLAASQGAAIVRGGGPQFSMGAIINPEDHHPGSNEPVCRQLFDVMGMPHTLVVNRDGVRFGDESYYVGINEALRSWDARAKKWINFPCFLILDDQFCKSYPLAGLPAGSDYPSNIVRAGDLTTLANLLGIDATALAETVHRFNENAERGIDPDFGRGSLPFVRRRYGDPDHHPNANLGPVSQPPFYGVPLHLLGTGMCTFGISTDEEGRVLRRDGTFVSGLFATGNAAATSEFRGYVTGYANSRNFAMAYAAMNAAAS